MRITFFEWSEAEEVIYQSIKIDLVKIVNSSYENHLEIEEVDLTSISEESIKSNENKDPLEKLKLEFKKDKFDISLLSQEEESFYAVSIFVDSKISKQDLLQMKESGVDLLLLRCAGYDMFDLDYAKEIGLKVRRVANYGTESIAEHVFALLLTLTKKINIDRRKHSLKQNGRDISQMGMSLKGKVFGIYGMGKIGRAVAHIAKYGFGMDVRFYDPHLEKSFLGNSSSSALSQLLKEYTRVDELKDLFSICSVLSIHTSLNDDTRGKITSDYLTLSKGLILINTARGEIVNLNDCIKALDKGNLIGLGLDVAGVDDSYELIPERDDIIFTQHTAYFTKDSVKRILEQTFSNIFSPIEENILCN